MIRIAVPGSAGKMGRMVIAAIGERADATLGATFDQGVDPRQALAGADVYIDFTAPAATAEMVTIAAERGAPAAVIGTTGLDGAQRRAIDEAAKRIPIVLAANFSVGVNLMLALVEQAARALPGFDLEIVELHHKLKRDAPSGTAIAIAEAGAAGRGVALRDVKRYAREGEVGARPAGEIGVVAVRGGDVVGEHTAYFLGPDERIELTHKAGSRQIFARGAVQAAIWLAGRRPGLYGMKDVLGCP